MDSAYYVIVEITVLFDLLVKEVRHVLAQIIARLSRRLTLWTRRV